MNQLIFNFKKSVDRKGLPEWPYKEKAIQDVAQMFINAAADRLSRAPFYLNNLIVWQKEILH